MFAQLRYIITVIFLLSLILSCKEKNEAVESKPNLDSIFLQTDVPLKTTRLGWTIKYLTDNDSSMLQVKWSKYGREGIYTDTIEYYPHSKFIPGYAGESEANIYMKTSITNSGIYVWVFSKTNFSYRIIDHVVEHDTITDRIVYLTGMNWEQDGKGLQVGIADLKSSKDTIINFKNLALGSFKEGYIDSIKFYKDKVFISGDLLDIKDNYRQRIVRETKIIHFKE